MLPDVNVEEWVQVLAHVRDHVLVSRLSILKCSLLRVQAEPSPAGSLDTCRVLVKNSDEFIHAAVFVRDCLVESTSVGGKLTVSRWAERFPEVLVVQVSARIEMNVL